MFQIFFWLFEHAKYCFTWQLFSTETISCFEECVERISEVRNDGEWLKIDWYLLIGDEEFREHEHWDVGGWYDEERQLKNRKCMYYDYNTFHIILFCSK